MNDELDRALADAIYGFPDISDTEKLTLTVPPAVIAALQPPKPADEIDALIASAGQWPIRVASWSEAL